MPILTETTFQNLDTKERVRLSKEYRELLSAYGKALEAARPIFQNGTIDEYFAATADARLALIAWCQAVDPRFFSADWAR